MAVKKENEGVDFSNFFNQQKNKPAQAVGTKSPGPKLSAKKIVAVVFAIASLGVSGYLFYEFTRQYYAPAAIYEPPQGYRISTSPNEPPKLEKIK